MLLGSLWHFCARRNVILGICGLTPAICGRGPLDRGSHACDTEASRIEMKRHVLPVTVILWLAPGLALAVELPAPAERFKFSSGSGFAARCSYWETWITPRTTG